MAISICLCIILAIVTLDQFSKICLMETSFTLIKNFIIIEPRYNDGAAFSSFSGARYFFLGFTVIALVVMFYFLFSGKWSKSLFFRLTLSIMIGGVIGNFLDRLILGPVRDFIYLPTFKFVCNIADIAITVACVMFVIYLFFIRDKEETQKKIEKIKEL